MGLAGKMFSRTNISCPLKSDCRRDADRRFVASMFEKDWEVFVIKRDSETGRYKSFTLCCEAANTITNVNSNSFSAACC